jgi:hypothetical protein
MKIATEEAVHVYQTLGRALAQVDTQVERRGPIRTAWKWLTRVYLGRAAPSGPPQYSGKVLGAADQEAPQTSEQDDPNPVGD